MKLPHRPLALATALISLTSAPSMALAQTFGPEAVAVFPANFVAAPVLLDFDGDGDRDVVTVGATAAFSGAWFESLGGSTFAAQRPLGPVDMSLVFQDAVAADLDGDGDDDIAFCGGNSTGVGWIENPGTGMFSAPQLISTSPNLSLQIEAADLNGDGLNDLVVPESNGRIGWFANLGNGSFGSRQVLSQTSGAIRGIDVADLDQDGDLDIVFAVAITNEIRWIEQTSAGAFASSAVLLDDVSGPGGPIVTDVNADGVQDLILAVTGGFSSRQIVLRPGLAAGGYGPPETLFSINSGSFSGFSLVDLQGNGDLDLVVASSALPTVLLRNTGASFSAPVSLPTEPSPTRAEFGAGDLDGDGQVDLVIVERRSVQVLRGGAMNFDPPIELVANVDFEPSPFNQALNTTADLSGDGIADVILKAGVDDSGYDIHFGLGGGSIASSGQSVNHPLVTQIEVVDLDADGDLDLVSSGGTFYSPTGRTRWAENLGSGQLADTVVLFSSSSNGLAEHATGDFDGDGDLDLLVLDSGPFQGSSTLSICWLEQVAPGVFAPGPTLAVNELPKGVRLADVDGDQIADVIITRTSSVDNSFVWRRGDGTGQFGAEVIVRDASEPAVWDAALGDIDGDGRIDVVVSGPAGIELHLWSTASLSFSGPTLVGGPTPGQGVTKVSLADVTGNGLPDVLASSESQNSRWIENAGGGSFGAPQPLPEVSLGSAILGAADRDGDLDIDILKLQPGNSLAWNANATRFGFGECGPAAVNSTGEAGVISAAGSEAVADNDVTLIVERLPASSFGFFLVAPMGAFFPAAGGSQGNLCLGGPVGRLNRGPGEIFQSNAAGTAEVQLNLQNIPTPTGAVALAPGDTRHFQAWFRDVNPGATSNFTNGLRISFE